MAQMTLRLSEDHERMLDDLQRRNPGVSRQKLFESMLEQSSREQEEAIATIAERIAASNPGLWNALRAR
jgi:predicted transcriptional regulator